MSPWNCHVAPKLLPKRTSSPRRFPVQQVRALSTITCIFSWLHPLRSLDLRAMSTVHLGM